VTARVLVTGSRLFTAAHIVQEALERAVDELGTGLVVVHGAARGADELADVLAPALGLTVERRPAAWDKTGLTAGLVRNHEMINAGADLCLAFRVDGLPCNGTSHCAWYAGMAGIPVRWYVQSAPDDRPAPRRWTGL